MLTYLRTFTYYSQLSGWKLGQWGTQVEEVESKKEALTGGGTSQQERQQQNSMSDTKVMRRLFENLKP